MALFRSTQATLRLPPPSADRSSEIVPIVGDFTVPAGFASADVVEMCPLPAGYVPVDLIVDNEAMGTTVTSNAGILSGAYLEGGARTCGAEFLSASAFQTATPKRADRPNFTRIAPTTGDRSVGFVASTVATPTVGSKVRFTLYVRPAVEGV